MSATRSTTPPPPTPIIEQLPANIPRLEPDGSNWAIVFNVHLREAIRAYKRWSYFEGSATLPAPAVPQNITAAVERLWKSTDAFDDPTRSYEDFMAETIALYPEAIAVRQPTFAALEELVADRARTPIRSQEEFREYYRIFLVISKFLISKNRLVTGEQARALLASFEPILARAVRFRLDVLFPYHDLQDPYKTEDIYDAAQYAIVSQAAWMELGYSPENTDNRSRNGRGTKCIGLKREER